MGGDRTVVDMKIDDPGIAKVGSQSRKELYGGK